MTHVNTDMIVNPHESDLSISKLTKQMQITIYGQIDEMIS